MSSVTQRIKMVKQPYGGYLKQKEFEKTEFDDNNALGKDNIHPSLVGMAVDYLTRFINGAPLEEAFKISLMGAIFIGDKKYAYKLLSKIKGLDNESIFSACKLVGYDVCLRAGPADYKNVRNIEADDTTINNIRIMVNRSITFFQQYGPIVKDGFTFEGGYTPFIDSGDGDFLTNDTLWEFKVLSTPPQSTHTLQLLIYYIMGKHSVHKEFDSIDKLGIFNPRLNCVYIKRIDQIPKETIDIVSKEIIGYDNEYTQRILEKEIAKEKERNKDLTLPEVMKILQCSRYQVMKLYAEFDLPLVKRGNKYYISKTDLYDWIAFYNEKSKEAHKREIKNTYIAIAIAIIFIIIMIIITFKIYSP